MSQRDKYLGQRLLRLKVIVRTHTHRANCSPRPLEWLVSTRCMFCYGASSCETATNHSMRSLSARARQLNKYHFRRRS